jgi:hypothetical protein
VVASSVAGGKSFVRDAKFREDPPLEPLGTPSGKTAEPARRRRQCACRGVDPETIRPALGRRRGRGET